MIEVYDWQLCAASDDRANHFFSPWFRDGGWAAAQRRAIRSKQRMETIFHEMGIEAKFTGPIVHYPWGQAVDANGEALPVFGMHPAILQDAWSRVLDHQRQSEPALIQHFDREGLRGFLWQVTRRKMTPIIYTGGPWTEDDAKRVGEWYEMLGSMGRDLVWAIDGSENINNFQVLETLHSEDPPLNIDFAIEGFPVAGSSQDVGFMALGRPESWRNQGGRDNVFAMSSTPILLIPDLNDADDVFRATQHGLGQIERIAFNVPGELDRNEGLVRALLRHMTHDNGGH